MMTKPVDSRRAWAARAQFYRRALAFLIDLSERNAAAVVADQESGILHKIASGLYEFNFALPAKTVSVTEYVNKLVSEIKTNPEELQEAISVVGDLLDAAADGKDYKTPAFIPGTCLLFEGTRHPHRTSLLTESVSGKLAQFLAWGAVQLLSTEEGEMVHRCKWKHCHLGRDGQQHVFLAARPPQEYCSRQCATAASFDRYKEALGEDAYRQQRREQYAKGPKPAKTKRHNKPSASSPSPRAPSKALPPRLGA